jgi:peptidoglycan/LPS O-acetylase OafA/YrhL
MGQQDAGDRSQLVTHHQRRDIQGLRAVAVGLVIANHVFHHPVGGFLGVDVFFVISGNLITGLLLREQGRTHRISLLDFYARRARRILPLALLVLAVTTALARLQLNVTRAHDTGVDALWALAFGSNVHFSHIGTDYFQQDRPASPIQHFWSLAVEEQFYVVWPAVLIVSYLLLRRSRTVVLLVLTAASFLWCLHATATSPTSAYFSTPARAWELGGGALLASIPDLLTRLTPRSRGLAGWCGTGLLLVCVLTIGTDGFPGNYAALPVLATALMLLSGEGRTPGWGIGRGLALAPVVYLGDLSYSLYLWHWPILVLGNAFVGDSLTDRLAILATTLAVSAASFHLLERPVLASDWLLRRRKPASSKRGLAIMVALLVAAVGTIVVATPPLPTAMKLDATDGPEAPPGGRPPVLRPPLGGPHLGARLR